MFWAVINDGPFVPKLLSNQYVDVHFKRAARFVKYGYGGQVASSGNNFTFDYPTNLMGTMFSTQFGGLIMPYQKYTYDNATTIHNFASLGSGEFTTVTPANRGINMTYANQAPNTINWTTQIVRNRYILPGYFTSNFFNCSKVKVPVSVFRNTVASNSNYTVHTRSAGTYTTTVTLYERTSSGTITSRGTTTNSSGAAITNGTGQVTQTDDWEIDITLTGTPAEDSIMYFEVEVNFSAFQIACASNLPGFSYDWQVGLYHADEIKPRNIVIFYN